MPALVGPGRVINEAYYAIAKDGEPIGEERIAIGVVDGRRVVVAQWFSEFGGHFETAYTVAPSSMTISSKGPSGTAQLAGDVVDGKLMVTGTGVDGKPVTASARLPENGFLFNGAVGGFCVLIDKLRDMEVGQKRELESLQILVEHAPPIGSARHQVKRQPDAGDNRVFTVATEAGRFRQTAELLVDPEGFIITQSVRGPVNLTYTRRP